MGQYLRSYTVFQRGNYATPVGIVLRIGSKHKLYIQRYTQVKTTYLHIAFLQYVEEGYLQARLQIGQFVDHKYKTVAAGYHSVVYHLLVRERQLHIGCLYRVQIAYQIGHTHIGRSQFFCKSFAAVNPAYRGSIAMSGYQFFCILRYGLHRVVVQRTARHNRYVFIHQIYQLARHHCFGLSPQSQEQYIVSAQNGSFHLGYHRFFIAIYTIKNRLFCL